MTRGDTLRVHIHVMKQKEGVDTYEEYFPEDGDACRFALKKPDMLPDGSDYKDQFPLIIKSIPIDDMILELEPGDTKTLPFGRYVYDVEFTFSDGTVDTFIAEATLELTPEVI